MHKENGDCTRTLPELSPRYMAMATNRSDAKYVFPRCRVDRAGKPG